MLLNVQTKIDLLRCSTAFVLFENIQKMKRRLLPRKEFDHEAGEEDPWARFTQPGLVESVDGLEKVGGGSDVLAGD